MYLNCTKFDFARPWAPNNTRTKFKADQLNGLLDIWRKDRQKIPFFTVRYQVILNKVDFTCKVHIIYCIICRNLSVSRWK